MQSGKYYKRIVIKIGSSLFYSNKNRMDSNLFNRILYQVSDLVNGDKKELIIVSSGAIALGMHELGLKSRPRDLPYLQAVAAIGQNILMDSYSRIFKQKKINCAQVLLTWEDFNDRKRYLNAKKALGTLLKIGSIPVINENDTVSTDEIRFGDNDRLSALVASLVNADLLIILSDVDGLLGKDGKSVIPVVTEITPEIKALASPSKRNTSVGGMITKIEAAKIAVDAGILCVIANGNNPQSIKNISEDPLKGVSGTLFMPKQACFAAKECWIAFGSKPKGRLFVDNGAKEAITKKSKSLLSVGIFKFDGKFNCADVVSIVDERGLEFARGLVNCSSIDLKEVAGKRYHKEIVHKNKLVVLPD